MKKINPIDNNIINLDLDNQISLTHFFEKIKNEYIKYYFKVILITILLFIIYIFIQTFSNRLLSFEIRFLSDQFSIWFLFLLYLTIHFFLLSSTKFSPTITNFLKTELYNIEYEIQKKYKIGISFFLFNGITIIVLIFSSIMIYYSNNDFIISLIIRLITIYIFSSIIIPILLGVLHDYFFVKLKEPYFVQINLKFRLMKHKEVESRMVGINMISNRLCLKSNQIGFNLYKDISKKRWLPINRRLIFPILQRRSHVYFHEYSTPINFKEHFLNIVSAIREWDIDYETFTRKIQYPN